MTQRKIDVEWKTRVRGTFNFASSGYDRSQLRFFRDSATRLVEFARVELGDRVLDIATGTGWAALAAAAKVGLRGKVVGIDLSPGMVARAREKARRQGLSNVAFRVCEAQRIPYRSDSFDKVLAAQAIFFMPNPLHALREWNRVVKPGGVLALASQGKAAFQPMMEMYRKLTERYGVPSQPPSGPTFETAKECCSYLWKAGLRNITSSIIDLGYPLPSANAWWTIVWSTGMRARIRRLAKKDLSRFRRGHLRQVESLRGSKGILLPMPTIFVAGRKPAWDSARSQ